MEDQLRFAVCYWHSFVWPGADPFGGETFLRPWHAAGGEPMAQAFAKADVAFEAVPPAARAVLHLPRPRHRARGRDAARIEPATCARSASSSQRKMSETGVRLLWGTANLFSNRRYHGRRRDQSRPRGLRLCRGAGEERARADARARRRELRDVGRPRRLRDPAQHRPQARAGAARPLPQPGGRAQAQDRLQGPAS